MFSLILGLVLFLGVHSISIYSVSLRDRLVARNEKAYKAVYAVLSFLGIYLIAVGYGVTRAEPVFLYGGVQSLRPLVSVAMLVAFILFVAPYFPGKIKAFTKNPQLWSVIVWSIAHLLVNGTLADVLLFGAFLIWAVADMISMKSREQRSVTPLTPSVKYDVVAVVVGVILTGLFAVLLHGSLIGMPLGR